MLNPSIVRAVLFDVDGTLSDTDDRMVQRLHRPLSRLPWFFSQRDPTSFCRWVVMAVETPGNFIYGIPDRLGLDDELVRLSYAVSRRFPNGRASTFTLVAGVREMLQTLSARYPLGVVSARDERPTLAFLNQFDLLGYFKVVVTGQSCDYTKPYPHPIRFAARALGVEPEACLMVGDTPVDMRSARSAGAQALGVLCGFGTRASLERAGAGMVLPSTALAAEALQLTT